MFDDKLDRLGNFGALLTDLVVALKREILSARKGRKGSRQQSEQDQHQKEKSAYEKAREAKIAKIRADIERVRALHPNISSEAWRTKS